nr:MAG TPA: hypothetical protein [Bacteriophage sp.]
MAKLEHFKTQKKRIINHLDKSLNVLEFSLNL